jgi:predicted MFS family arabinose efflux permease
VLFGCALLAGAGFPPISGSMKVLWPRLIDATTAVATAYAAESMIQQVLLLVAPLVTTALIAWIGGGIAGSFHTSRATYARALARLSVALTVPALVAVLSGGSLLPMAFAYALAGLFLTPVATASYVVVGTATLPAHRTEAFTWLSTAIALGGSAGSALAGAAIDRFGVLAVAFLPAMAAGLATAVAGGPTARVDA